MRSNKAHRLLALLLAFVMTFSLLPTVTWAADNDCSAAGDGSVTWKYDADTTTLTISGTGAMKDYASVNVTPWNSYKAKTKTIIIGEGVTRVGNSAFASHTALTSVSLPATLESIGQKAFMSTRNLAVIDIPAKVSTIETGAFMACPGKTFNFSEDENTVLQKILKDFEIGTVPNVTTKAKIMCNVTSESAGSELAVPKIIKANTDGTVRAAFYGKDARVEVYVTGKSGTDTGAVTSKLNVTTFKDTSTNTTAVDTARTVVVGEGVTELCDQCFSGYKQLESVTLPSTMKRLNSSAFSSCSKLATINLPAGLEEIGDSCFSVSTALTKVTIPASIRKIGKDAFAGSDDGKEIYIEMTSAESDNVVTYGQNWWGSATVYYRSASGDGYEKVDVSPYAWLEGVTFTFTEGGKALESQVYLNVSLAQFTYEVDSEATQGDFTIENAGLTLTKDGQPFTDAIVTMPKELNVTKTSNAWQVDGSVVLTPKEGIRGEAQTLKLSITLKEKPYQFEGDGTKTNPYKINSLFELQALQGRVNNHGVTYEGQYFLQTADIDMSGVESWNAIGFVVNSSSKYPFKATYDGGGHKIVNWNVDCNKQSGDTRYIGLFGQISTLKNLTIDKTCTFKLRSWSGTLAYQVDYIENCFNYATVTAQTTGADNANASIGGLAENVGKMVGCANYGDITINGGGTVGGLAAICNNAVNCRNYGTVTASGTKVGGICAELSALGNSADEERGVISGCANYGTVNADERAGGLVGELSGIMEDCYNLGTVKVSKTTVGGLVGIAYNTSSYTDKVGVFNSYHAGSVQYGSEEAEPVAGHLIGSLAGSGGNEKALGSLYYQQVGILPAVGDYDAGDYATGMTLNAMQAPAFVDKLNEYTNISLRGVTWKQGDSESQNLPVCDSFETLKNYACDLTGLTVNGNTALLDKSGDYYFVLPHGTDLTKVTVATTISPRATVKPADGTVDFSNGPVDFTVTAEDGTHSKTYPVTVTAADSANGLTALRLGSHVMGRVDSAYTSGAMLLDPNDFAQGTTTYSFTQYDTVVIPNGASHKAWNYYSIWAIPAETGATITAAIGDRTQTIAATTDMTANTSESINYADLMRLGENTLTLTVTPPKGGSGTETVYTFKLTVLPTLKTVTFAEEGLEQDQAFVPETLNYTLKVPDSVTALTPTVAATLTDGSVNVTYSPDLESGKIPLGKLDNGKFTITVSDAETGTVKTVYTYTVESIGTYDAKITTTNADGAQVRVYQGDTLVTPGKNGVYSLRTDKTYTYVVVAKGYVTKTGTLSGSADLTDGVLNVTLTAAPTLTLPKYDAFWPNFRGNDQNMAITSVKTPTGQIDAETESSDVELLWASASGSGYDSGAVGSPIFVGGYMYAYAGTRLLKLDPATGETVASVNMASNSDFAIIPPTYADGMIFVALKEGCVQAFRADTLESLWVYQDPLKGQSNSPITYSDGYVYVGFWNGESKPANFVCLTADYEGTSTKEALWRYTSDGGFYWAGAYANDKYVVVGTDDGQSGYTSQTAKLVVFDKRTGEIVDSKEGYTGDIRSNIAYADGRVYFTSKGGYFYSEVLGSDGKLSGSKSIALGGMSTSTPVVYNNRAYVGVSGEKQFTAYSGHHIAVLDLNSWSVAYTAITQGYPQTSGLLSTNTEDGSVNVYFMDNYTPGVMRVINDRAGQTELKNGITENDHANCAPVVFKPEGPLAQYCISSPVVDEYGTLYFKNDSGNLIALTSAVKELVVAEAPESVDVDGNKVQVTGGKIVAKLANGMERDVTNVVTYRTYNEGAVEAVYTYGTDVGNYTLSTKTVSLAQPKSDIKIGNGTNEGTTENGVTTFKAGTSADAPEIKVTAPAAGWKLGESNTFTVASDNDVACVVLVKKADGTYQKLTATTGENGKHSFTATLAADDSIVVALKGDVSGDGVIGMDDATQVMNAWVNETEISAIGIFAANVTNAAEAISMNNATAIMNAWVNETAFAW